MCQRQEDSCFLRPELIESTPVPRVRGLLAMIEFGEICQQCGRAFYDFDIEKGWPGYPRWCEACKLESIGYEKKKGGD